MNKSTRNVIILAGIAVFVFIAIWGGVTLTRNVGKDPEVLSNESAANSLDDIYNNIRVSEETPPMGLDTVTTSDADTLPDISKYPPQVDKTTDSFIEIFSSTEKAGTGADAWMTDMANEFNEAGITVNGKPVSVRLRGIASGEGMDYISTGKYIPDVYTPSNELWGEMLKAKGVTVTLAEKRIAGNVTGVLFSKSKNDELIKKYGSINLKIIVDAIDNKEILMGYTNPFASSTGLNFLVSALLTFDSANPLSDTAVAAFEKFQTNIPFVAYTTLQMRESAKSGALDGFILENQIFYNSPELQSDYIFTPFGARHDSPVYEIGTLSAEKKQILKEFIAYCNSEQSQEKATEY
ncbi:MAG: substrate-binding domain-containing protein, partial [Lachnoclostridium sp.]|nr:substrate-binding domain-containing protein [Lachnoclostridium sp.]